MVSPDRRYRISGNKGDAIYFAITGYNEPSPGAWSDKVVLHKHDSDMDVDADGNFSFEIGPVPDIAAIVTRDYQLDAESGRPVTWHIEALESPDPIRHGDEETAAELRASAAWLKTMFMIIPLTIGVRAEEQQSEGHEIANAANTMGPPYQVPDNNFGWSARDACYSFGGYDLAEDEALVITHTPAERRGSGASASGTSTWPTTRAGDGRTSVNIAPRCPTPTGRSRWWSATARPRTPTPSRRWTTRRGNLAFRSFLPDHVPEPPSRFWSMCVWNQFMANHSAGDGRTSVKSARRLPNADGTVTIVVSHGPSRHPNAVSTMDYPRGNLAFRWFLPDSVPEPPEVSLLKLEDAPTADP